MFDMVTEFFDHFGLEVSTDGREKTVYTSNREGLEPTTIMHHGKAIAWLKQDESYKYLGVHINLLLDWTKQIEVSNLSYIRHLAYLRRRCFTASQTAEILNLVVFPAITYRMSVVPFPAHVLKEWDSIARGLMAHKLRTGLHLGYKHWSLPMYNGGYNLFRLCDLQIINSVAIYLNYAANSDDIFAKVLTLSTFEHSGVVQEIQSLLTNLKLKMQINPAMIEENYEFQPHHYLPQSTLLNALTELGVSDICKLITNTGKLQNALQLEYKLKVPMKSAIKLHEEMQDTLCVAKPPRQKILPHILTITETSPQFDFESEPEQASNFFYDEEYKAYEAFVDESKKDDKASFGVYFKEGCPLNTSSRARGPQSLQNATMQGVEYVLENFPTAENITIYIDRESVFKLLTKLPITGKLRHTVRELNMLEKINKHITVREGKTTFKQVYSHLKIDGLTTLQRAKLINRHLHAMVNMYGTERAARLRKRNEGADKLSDEGLKKDDLLAPELSMFHNLFVLKSTRKKASAKSSFKGFISERYRPTVKTLLRKELKEDICGKKDHYEQWVDSNKVSPHTWGILKSLDPEDEHLKKHFVRIMHNNLPTKAKIQAHKAKEKDGNKFWTNKYHYVTNSLCSICGRASETIDHLHSCNDGRVVNIRAKLAKKLAGCTSNKLVWFHCKETSNPLTLKHFNPLLGSRGVIPKILPMSLNLGENEKEDAKRPIRFGSFEMCFYLANTQINKKSL